MNIQSVQDADMGAIMEMDGHRFQWNGGDYACLAGDITNMKPNQDGGFLAEYDLTITARVVDLPSLPSVGNQVSTSLSGTSYRIERVRRNHWGTLVALDLINANKL
jgi:hypothetical protein